MRLPFKRLHATYFVAKCGIPQLPYSVRNRRTLDLMGLFGTRREARAECKRLNGPIRSKWASMNALGGFADAVFTPYQQSGARRDAIIEHIYDASAFGIVGEYSKIVCRRIAIYHLYLANRK